MNSKHFIGIHGYMLVYSVGSKQSFEMRRIIRDKILNHLVRLPRHGQHVLRAANKPPQGAEWVPIMLVGNKSDLRDEQRQVSAADGKKLAEEFKCGFIEASAKYGENVNKGFERMIMEIEKLQNPGEPTGGQKCIVQ